MLLKLIVKIHDMKYVKQLPLVLMKPLYLNIKDRSGIHLDTVILKNIPGKTNLVLILDVHELLLSLFIIGKYLDLIDLGKIGYPVITHSFGNPLGKKRIAV